jgi:nitronate monooxygenase
MTAHDALNTPLVGMLGCRYPIVQTAMGWVARPELVAASCNAGAFGFLAAASLSADEVGPSIDRVRELTDRPFGVNFHMFQPGAARIVDTIIAAKVRAVSFGRGPDKNIIRRFRDAGIVCMLRKWWRSESTRSPSRVVKVAVTRVRYPPRSCCRRS